MQATNPVSTPGLNRFHSIKLTIFAVLCAGILSPQLNVRGQVATFENFSEGLIGSSFVDPLSGIAFSDAQYNLGAAVFAVEYGPTLSVPPVLPGNCLGGTYSPDTGFALEAGFRFTFTLPTPSTQVELDVIYGALMSAANINFFTYASGGQSLFATNFALTTGSGLKVIHPVIVSDTPMSKIVIGAPNSMAFGYDNIAVPEPSTIGLTAIGIAAALVIRRRK